MRTLGLLLFLNLALASPLAETRKLYAQGEMARLLVQLEPLLPGAPPLRFSWSTWEEPAFTLRLKPLYFRLREFWRGGP